ncbi:PAS domain-containing sensor histidine kinase [Siphonobacter sp. BAB-5385]|uniref:PAS domain-containing sensor histidine kinase n=1 Tax=Siphonobacter sp. BAB-5385 TaxID=1864822 RepID=UPI000B9E3C15|nr:PAS domain-containing protein [Siphonobacter sp. BAB-5385]OZI07323.1 PAS domain-containing sensor histidine kinase [Siphonobacter sp. BAB-5385]
MAESPKPFSHLPAADDERLKLLLQTHGVGTWVYDSGQGLLRCDAVSQELFGFALSTELPYEAWLQTLGKSDQKRVQSVFQDESLASSLDIQCRNVLTNRWIRLRASRIGSSIAGLVEVIPQDRLPIMPVRQAFKTLLEHSPIAVALLDKEEWTYQMVNPYYTRLISRSSETLLGKPLREAMPELLDRGFEQILEQVIQTRQSLVTREVAVYVSNSEEIETLYLDFTYQPQRNDEGEITGVLVVGIDVTAQVQARKAVEASEARLKALIATAPVAIGLFVGRDLLVELPNQAFIDIVGKGPNIVGKPLREVMPELENQPFLQILDDVYTTGNMYQSYETQVNIVQDGVMTHNLYNIIYSPLFDAQGQVYAILDIAADVTPVAQARQQIQEAEESLRGAIELAQLATWSMDMESGKFTYSERLRDWMGLAELSAYPEEVYELVPEEYRNAVRDQIDAVIAGSGYYENENVITHRHTGYQRTIHAQARVYHDAQGKPYKLAGTAQDVTQQRETQRALEQLVQQRTEELAAANEELASINEQLESSNEELEESNVLFTRSNENLEQFAYIASHDLQEPLRKVQQFGDILMSRYSSQLGDGVTYLKRMQVASQRMSLLISDLLTLSRLSSNQEFTELVSLTEILKTVLSDLELRIQESKASIRLEPLPMVRGDILQLGQLFQNILSNALKFRQPQLAPAIRMHSTQLWLDELPQDVQPARMAEAYACITIADNGIGFDEQYSQRIFQVFQRLHGKSEYPGTGIGLAICEKVVRNHGGAITAESQPGQGATFRIYLPVEQVR